MSFARLQMIHLFLNVNSLKATDCSSMLKSPFKMYRAKEFSQKSIILKILVKLDA